MRSRAGPELSLGIAWGDPHGQREAGDSLSEVVVGQAAFELGAGWRTAFGLHLNAHAQYGFVLGRGCAASCSGSDVRLGLGLEYHFTPGDRVDHYIGLGAGYEWLALDFGEGHLAYHGFEWLNLRLGEEFALGTLGLGPIAILTLGRYEEQSRDVPPVPELDRSIDEAEVHVWFFLGVRMSYGWAR